MKIGPGMAPQATSTRLKVFGCEGSTDVVIPALDWALDPDGDGDFSDHLDVVNLSLGSDYGRPTTPTRWPSTTRRAAGRALRRRRRQRRRLYDTGGSPGNAPRGIGVAATIDGYSVFDGWQVIAPAGLVAGIRPGLRSAAYSDTAADVPSRSPATWPNTPAGNEDALRRRCRPARHRQGPCWSRTTATPAAR